MKVFKKTALLLSVIVLAVLLSVGVIAGVAQAAEGDATLGEVYNAVQVTTDGKVNLKVYYSELGNAQAFVAEVVDPDSGEVKTYNYTLDQLEETSDGKCVRVPLAASEMTHTVRVWATAGDEKSTVREFSVAEYAREVLSRESQAKYHDAMRALLNWGAYAQGKFGDAGNHLANVALFSRNTNAIYNRNSIAYKAGTVTNGTTITGNTMDLSLEPGNITVHFYVNYTGSGTLTATVSKDGGDPVPSAITKTEKGWLVKVSNVSAKLFDTPYTVTITDGEDTFTATKTVNEYLGILLNQCNDSGDHATGNVVRAMYQFYQITTGNTGAETCEHGNSNKHNYWITENDGTQTVKCVLCHAVLGKGIDAGVNAYASAGTLKNASLTGSTDKTVMTENGVQFVRYNNFYANRDNWGDIGLTSVFTGNLGVTGQYMVVKFRAGATDNGRTNLEFYANTNKGGTGTTNLVSAGATQIIETNDNQWHTVIINLAERVADPSKTFVDEGDGTYNVRYLSVRMFSGSSVVADDSAEGRYAYTYSYTKADNTKGYETFYGAPLTEEQLAEKVAAHADYALIKCHKQSVAADAYIDIAYIALCDSAEEAKTLIDTATYEVSTANNKSMYYNTADDTCAHHSRDAKEHVDGNTYGYNKCAQCGEYEHSKTLADSVKLYFSPYTMSTLSADMTMPLNPRVHYNFGSKSFVSESDVAYFGFAGKDDAAQFIWNRTGYDAAQAYTMDVGNAKYLVLKMRLSNTSLSANFGINFSTTAAGSHTFNALPVKNSTAGQWATYVIDLASVYGSQYGLDSESNTYKVDTFYFHTDKLMKTDKIDIAGFAFVEGDWSEVAKLVDTDTAIVQTVKSGAGVVVDAKTGECVGGVHADYSIKAVDGVYKYTCDACGHVARNTGVKADAVGLYWAAEELYRRSTASSQTASTEGAYWTGGPANQYLLTEDGETFLRLSDLKTNSQWGGWFPVNSGGGYPHPGSGRYMVIKVRQNDNSINSTSIPFWVTSAGSSNTWDKGSFSVALPEDNQWHVIVVDLAERAAGYTTDANGEYGIKTVHIRPFGGYTNMDNAHDEVMDIAYMAFFNDLADLKDIIAEDTFEMSKTSSSSVVLNTETLSCAMCTPTYVADDTDARGYHYECSACGKDFAIDYYTSGKGGVFNYNNGQYAGTFTSKTDAAGFKYMSFLSTGPSGTFFDYNTNNGAGGGVSDNAVRAGRFLVVKLKGDTTANVKFHVGTDDYPKSNNNYVGGSLGELTPTTMPKEWQVAVIDLAGLANYSVGGSHKIFFSSTTGGGTTVAQGAQVDIAYMALVSNIADAQALAGDEAIMYYGNSFNNTPEVLDLDCSRAGHIYGYETATGDNGKTITYSCVVCGDTHVQTVSNDVNYYADLNSMGKYTHNLSKNLIDADNGVLFNRYYGKGGNHINITGGGSAGSPTGSTYTTGKYIAMKYRVYSANVPADGNTNSFNLNIATGDKKSGNGSSVSSTALYVKNIEQDVWRVVLIDVSGNKQWTSDGSAQQIYIMITAGGNSDYTFDVAWVAVVDSVNEFKTLLTEGEAYYDYGTGWSTANPKHLNQDGTCVSCVGEETVSGNTYTYTCSACGKVVKTITLDESVKKYMSANQLHTTAKTYYGGSHAYKYDYAANVAYMDTSVIQTIWQRHDHDMSTTQTSSDAENYSENVGNAKYLVIKARSSDEAAYIMFQISTTAKNCSIGTITEADFTDGVLNATKATWKKILEDGTTDSNDFCAAVGDQYYHGTAMCGIYLMGKGQATGEWTTYVVDLETVADGFYEKVDGQDYYDVDTFYFHNAGNNDIAYVAFVEGSWAEIDALVEEDTVVQITGHGNSNGAVSKVVNVADGSDAQ